MSVAGGPSYPTVSLADGAAIGAGATETDEVSVLGARLAWINVYCTEDFQFGLLGKVASGITGTLMQPDRSQGFLDVSAATTYTFGPVSVEGLSELGVWVNNQSASAGTYTTRVGLVY